MSVDSTNPQYKYYKDSWKGLRDCSEGQKAIHASKTKYLPKLGGQNDEEYLSYLKRSLFYNATSRTIDGLSGLIFRKSPQLDIPKSIEPYKENISLNGLSLHGFCEEIVEDVLTVGRAGILIDYPNTINENISVAEAEAVNIRPFFSHYKAENIINWKTKKINNLDILCEVRLMETVQERKDEFDYEDIQQIRVLDLDDNLFYRQRFYRKNKQTNEWQQYEETIYPLMNGSLINFIPFVFCGVKNNSPDIEKPPLLDLSNVNLSHYQTSADIEHGAHYTALPTVVVSGVSDEDVEYKIGSASAWVFSNPDTKAEFLEFKGQGLGALEKRSEKKEAYMASLGARMLSPEKKAAEAAETAQIHRSGENSVLSSISKSVSMSIQKALEIMVMWVGSEDEVLFALNTDFVASQMNPQQLQALVQSWQSGAIAFDDLVENLKKGEIIREDRSSEDIMQDVSDENPFTDEDLNV